MNDPRTPELKQQQRQRARAIRQRLVFVSRAPTNYPKGLAHEGDYDALGRVDPLHRHQVRQCLKRARLAKHQPLPAGEMEELVTARRHARELARLDRQFIR